MVGTQSEAWDLRDLSRSSRSQFWVTPLCDAPAVSVAILTISDIARPPQQAQFASKISKFAELADRFDQIWVSILGPPIFFKEFSNVKQCSTQTTQL